MWQKPSPGWSTWSVEDTLALGMAQLGQPYGIANRTGQPDETVAHAILEQAWQPGVRYLDTAQTYDRSKEIIGHYVRSDPEATAGLRAVTKLSASVTVGGSMREILDILAAGPELRTLNAGTISNVRSGHGLQ